MTSRRVVRRIDHAYMVVDDAKSTFEMLRNRLGLVPLLSVFDLPDELHASAGRASGTFNLGNFALEVVEFPGHLKATPGSLEVSGIVFEPEPVAEAVAELDRRGIAHLPPNPLYLPESFELPMPDIPLPSETEGARAPGSLNGTQILLQGFIGGLAGVMCYEWAFAPVPALRRAMRQRLDEMPHRPLPIEGTTEVLVGAADLASERDRWQRLLDPVGQDEPGLWRFDDGPALRLIEHDHDAILGLKLHVTSLERAERYLKEQDMLASSTGAELAIDPETLEGLNLTLVGDSE